MYLKLIIFSVWAVCTQAHHFPPGLEGTLMTLPTDGFVVEVLLLPVVAEVGQTIGLLISIQKAENEHYYTGPISLELRPASGPESARPIQLETLPRPDLQGDREARHIFREPGRYVATLGFQPEGKILAVTFPLEVVVSSGPSLLYLGLLLAVFVGAILIVGYLQRDKNRAPEKATPL
jgi:hypothetical protein